MIILSIVSIALYGADPASWFSGGKPVYLLLSGLIGLALGDSALFRSMLVFGPRRATLVMSTVPIMTSLIGWGLLGERLNWIAWSGILLTVGGVGWVVLERGSIANGEASLSREALLKGLVLGAVAAACQSVGMILAKSGMGNDIPPLAATLLRMLAGWAGMLAGMAVAGRIPSVIRSFGDARGMALTGAGVIVGPVLGVWLSLVSIRYAETGVAAALMGLMPVMVIPWVWMIYGERVSARGIIGSIIAVAGSAILFYR